MSLLNEVLQDIDQRRRESTDQGILTSFLSSPQNEKFDWGSPLIVLIFVVVFGSVTYWAVNSQKSESSLNSIFELPMPASPLSVSDFYSTVPFVEAVQTPKKTPGLTLPMELRSGAQNTEKVQNQGLESNTTNLNSASNLRPVSVVQQIEVLTLSDLVEQAVSGAIELDEFQADFNQYLGSADSSEITRAMARFDYSSRSVDDLLSLLIVNKRLIVAKNMDRTSIVHDILSQLRLKSAEPGYWAFQQAVLYDKTGESRQAYYYYRQALRSDHVSTKQRQLSQLRVEQLQGQLR